MSKSATFTLPKIPLLQSLSQINKLTKSSRKRKVTIEITVFKDHIKLVVPGIDLDISATASGAAKATLQLWYFTDIISNEKDDTLDCKIIYDQLHINGSVFKAQTTYFEDDKILRSIKLPVNYTFIDIASLYLSERYTNDEILFNNLDGSIKRAKSQVNHDIEKIAYILSKYNVTKEEVETIIINKLNL